MCGIFAAINLTPAGTGLSEARARAATRTLQHRGPDGSAVLCGPQAALGHTRLAIIDLDLGDQPMVDPASGLSIVFNGEIYNHRELRKELEQLGHDFRTHSDTEVILKAYAQWGEAAVERLRGMFAFVIHDERRGEAFAARDRLGIKPLYWSQCGDTYLFGSEMTALFATDLVAPERDEGRYAEYLVFGYAAGPATLFKTVRSLEPGHHLKITAEGARLQRYWQPFDGPERDPGRSEGELTEALDALLRDSAEAWCLADVPVGALMSGGVDSPTVAAIANGVIPDFHTYSLSLARDSGMDETPLINCLVERLKLNNTQLEPSDSEMLSAFHDLTDHFDEPVLDPNNLVLMELCHLIRKRSDLKVVLCGEGADEIFGGYERHRALSSEPRYTSTPRDMALGLGHVSIPRLRTIGADADFAMPERLAAIENLRSRDPLNRILEYDQLTFLSTRLHSQDRVGMYFGIEIRTPLLDHQLVEFANRLPARLKVSDKWSKYLLRKVAARYVPEEVAWNANKIGLSIPYSRLVESGSLRTIYEETVLNGELTRLYDRHGLARLLDEHRPSETGVDHSNTLWRLIALAAWLSRPFSSRVGQALAAQ